LKIRYRSNAKLAVLFFLSKSWGRIEIIVKGITHLGLGAVLQA
jgi:hypothetical protein